MIMYTIMILYYIYMPICLDGGMKIFNKPNTQLFWGEQQGSLLLTLFIVKDDLQKVKLPHPTGLDW